MALDVAVGGEKYVYSSRARILSPIREGRDDWGLFSPGRLEDPFGLDMLIRPLLPAHRQ